MIVPRNCLQKKDRPEQEHEKFLICYDQPGSVKSFMPLCQFWSGIVSGTYVTRRQTR